MTQDSNQKIGTGQTHFQAGDTATKQDAVGDSMFVVIRGCCEVTMEGKSQEGTTGGQVTLALHTIQLAGQAQLDVTVCCCIPLVTPNRKGLANIHSEGAPNQCCMCHGYVSLVRRL